MAKNARKILTKYQDDYPDLLIEHMSDGLSFESFGAKIEVHKDTLYEWLKKYEEFRESYLVGQAKSRLFWERLGVMGCQGLIKNFSATVWIFTMKCRFGYRDGSETGHQSESKHDQPLIYKTQWRKLENMAKKEK